MNPTHTLPWDVLIIAGAAGTGKTSVTYKLARHFGVGITEVDDLHLVLETMTTPEQQPQLHYWRTKPDDVELTVDSIVELHISVARLMSPALKAVIINHIEERTPTVLEGDYILPELLLDDPVHSDWHPERVRAVFLFEPDERQLVQNFLSREPSEGEQRGRAHVSRLYGEWLRRECDMYGVPALPTRPWKSLFDRIVDAIS